MDEVQGDCYLDARRYGTPCCGCITIAATCCAIVFRKHSLQATAHGYASNPMHGPKPLLQGSELKAACGRIDPFESCSSDLLDDEGLLTIDYFLSGIKCGGNWDCDNRPQSDVVCWTWSTSNNGEDQHCVDGNSSGESSNLGPRRRWNRPVLELPGLPATAQPLRLESHKVCNMLARYRTLTFAGDSFVEQLFAAVLSLASGNPWSGSLWSHKGNGPARQGDKHLRDEGHSIQWSRHWNSDPWILGHDYEEELAPHFCRRPGDLRRQFWDACRVFRVRNATGMRRICGGRLRLAYVAAWNPEHNVTFLAHVLRRGLAEFPAGPHLLVVGAGAHFAYDARSFIEKYWPPIGSVLASGAFNALWLAAHALPSVTVQQQRCWPQSPIYTRACWPHAEGFGDLVALGQLKACTGAEIGVIDNERVARYNTQVAEFLQGQSKSAHGSVRVFDFFAISRAMLRDCPQVALAGKLHPSDFHLGMGAELVRANLLLQAIAGFQTHGYE